MKKLSTILCVLALAALTASAQSISYQALSVPSVLAGGTTNLAAPQTIVCKQQNVAIAANVSGAAAVTNIYTFIPSIDGVNYATNVSYTLTAYSAGATVNTVVSNFNVAGYSYLRLYTIQCVGGSGGTNTLGYAIKTGAP